MIFPAYSVASSSMSGAIMRHGPHHGAQKSTSTGTGLFRTSASKVASVTGVAAARARRGKPCSARCVGARGRGKRTARGAGYRPSPTRARQPRSLLRLAQPGPHRCQRAQPPPPARAPAGAPPPAAHAQPPPCPQPARSMRQLATEDASPFYMLRQLHVPPLPFFGKVKLFKSW